MTTFITLDDAALLVGPGVHARTLRTAREKGLLRCARVGREWRTTAEEIERYKERLWESSSSSTDQTGSTGPSRASGSPGTSGTFRTGARKAAAGLPESAQLAASLARELTRRKPIG